MRTLVLMTACLVVVMSSLLVAQPPQKRNSPPDFFFVPLIQEISDGESSSPSRAVRAAQKMYSAPAASDMHFVKVEVPVLGAGYAPPASRPRPVGAVKKAISSTIGQMKKPDADMAGIFADEEAVDRQAKASGSEEAIDYFSYDLPESPIEEIVAGTIPGTEDQHFVPVFTPILQAGYGPPASRRKPLGVVKQPHEAVEITEDGEPKSFPGLLADDAKVENSDAMRGEFITSSGVKRVGYEVEATKTDKPKSGLKELEGDAPVDSGGSDLNMALLPPPVKYIHFSEASATETEKPQLELDWVPFLAETVLDLAFGSIGGVSDCEPADFQFTTNDVQIIQSPSASNGDGIQRIGIDFDFNIPDNSARADGQPPVRMDTLHNDPDAYVTAMTEHSVPVLNKVPYVSRLFKNTGVAHLLKFEANDDHAEHLLHAAGHLSSAAMPQDALRIKNRALSIKVELLHQAYLDQFNQALGLREQVALLERNAKDAAAAAQPKSVGLVTVFAAQPESRVNVLLHDKTVTGKVPHIGDRVWGIDSGDADGACLAPAPSVTKASVACVSCLKAGTACTTNCCSAETNVTQVAVTPAQAVRYHAIQTHARALSICANSNTTGRLIRSHTEESLAPASIPTPVDSTEASSAAAAGAVKAASHRSATGKAPVIERANFLNLSAELTVRQNRGYDNRRVIHLSKKYFSAEEIIDLLTRHAEDSEFDVSPEAIQEMKENGVNEAVIDTIRKLAK